MTVARVSNLELIFLTAALACSGYGTGPSSSNVASVEVTLAQTEIVTGQHDQATAVARDQYGTAVNTGTINWTSTFPAVAVVNAMTGQIVAVAPGQTEIVATVAGKTGRKRITVS